MTGIATAERYSGHGVYDRFPAMLFIPEVVVESVHVIRNLLLKKEGPRLIFDVYNHAEGKGVEPSGFRLARLSRPVAHLWALPSNFGSRDCPSYEAPILAPFNLLLCNPEDEVTVF